MVKIDSLYNEGMKICIFSKQKYEESKVGWYWGGHDISYSKNDSSGTYIPQKDVTIIH
jgi:hypothetical protein